MLLAEKNGWISLVVVLKETKTTVTLKHIGAKDSFVVRRDNPERKLFESAQQAEDWIKSLQPSKRVMRIQEGSREYKRREKLVFDTYAPTLVTCRNCGSPRHEKYVCQFCNGE